MEPNAATAESQMEVIRRRADLGASSAAIGADSANSMNPDNPIAAEGGTQMMTDPQAPSGGAAGFPSEGAGQQLKQEKSESRYITETLSKRLSILSKKGE